MKKYLFLLAIVGLASMIIQIGILTNFLSIFPESSAVSGTIIGGWIFGLGIGGMVVSKKNVIKNPEKYISLFQYSLGVLILSFVIFSDKIFTFLTSLSLLAFPLTFMFITGVGMFGGTTFLLLNTLNKEDKDVATAKLYSADTFGSAFGSVVAGVLLLPYFGIKTSLISASVLAFGVGFHFSKKDKVTAYLPLIMIPILMVSFISADTNLGFNKQSQYGEIEVLENGQLKINGRVQCSFYNIPDEQTEKTIVGYSLNPFNSRDIDVLNIGLGCGGTLNEIPKYTSNEIDIVEINKVVVEANKDSSDILKNKQFNLIVDEGIHYLRNSDTKYDSIIIDIENPGVIHSSDIYTEESFKIIKDSLNEGGTFGLWMHPCGKENYYDIVYNTLHKEFEYVYLLEENLFISSKTKLDYGDYVYFSDEKRTNTLDKKILSNVFETNCWEWDK